MLWSGVGNHFLLLKSLLLIVTASAASCNFVSNKKFSLETVDTLLVKGNIIKNVNFKSMSAFTFCSFHDKQSPPTQQDLQKKNRINLKIVLKHPRVKFVGRYYHHLMPFYMVTFKDTSWEQRGHLTSNFFRKKSEKSAFIYSWRHPSQKKSKEILIAQKEIENEKYELYKIWKI